MVATATGRPAVKKPFKQSEIPHALIHEIMDGKPLYYKGYRDVMNKTKQIEEIMGNSSLQSRLLGYLLQILFAKIDPIKWEVTPPETGLHLDRRNNLSVDIAVFSTENFTGEKTNNKYTQVPPFLAIEVDTQIEFEAINPSAYVSKKTQTLLNFGVDKVVWFFTASKTVLIARKNEDWLIRDWEKDVELMPGIVVNVADFLLAKGIQF